MSVTAAPSRTGFSALQLRDDCLRFFQQSEAWRKVINLLARGPSVRHLHLYVDTSIDPRDLERVIRAYFEVRRWPLTRRIAYIPGPGYVNIYNIHPIGKAHFEVIARYNPDATLTLTAEGATHKDAGRNLVYWDDEYMNAYYSRYKFRETLGRDEMRVADEFFRSHEWERACDFMSRPGSLHSHVQVKTSIHPETLKEYGAAAMRKRGWQVYWAVGVVYQPGSDAERPKIVYLVSHPETQMEIEWYYDENCVLSPHNEPITLIKTQESTQKYFDELSFNRLSDEHIEYITCRL